MRLEKIKLAGFKSFVDPTTLPLPGNLVGIVGPNGCGKSNIIDAVRWVMGESSAKHLRGENMADVIFNGSSTRKPVSMAAVELVFDNAEGKAPGEFARYPQISIKRQVTRDGQSTYLLNGTRCRRKDITDLFLGTGLGSRSYAIIEQGTISRLVEAKPEELRELIEEAAGISKYKERRHETELRLAHTQDNLDRLRDLRDEVGRQLESLRRQVKKAEQFVALRAEERRYREQLLALRWRRHEALQRECQDALAGHEARFRALYEQNRALDAALETQRRHHQTLQNTLQEQQAHYYELGAEIARLDQIIEHARRTQESLLKEQSRLQEENQRARRDLDQDLEQLKALRDQAAATAQALEHSRRAEAEAQAARDAAERALLEGRQGFADLRREIDRDQTQVELHTVRLRQLEQRQRQLDERRGRLRGERDELASILDSGELDELRCAARELEAERGALEERLRQLDEEIRQQRRRVQDLQHRLDARRAEAHALEGRIGSLETLQHHAMGKDRAKLRRWLAEQGLERALRLAECLEVQPGWEAAVESVLGHHLEALCVESAAPYVPRLAELADESVAFLETRAAPSPATPATGRLLERVRAPWSLAALLGSVHCADSLEQARAASARLADHESVVTRDGVRFGNGWLSAHRRTQDQAGIIQRERELREARARRDAVFKEIQILQEELAGAATAVQEAEREHARVQADERRLSSELTRAQAEASAAAARHDQAAKRLRQIEQEQAELEEQWAEHCEELAETRTLRFEAEERLAHRQPQAAQWEAHNAALEARLVEADTALAAAREQRHGLQGRLESLRSSEALIERHLERAQHQFQHSSERLAAVAAQTTLASSAEDERLQRDGLLALRAQAERALAELRRQAGEAEAEIRRLEEARQRNGRELEDIKGDLERIKLELSANAVRRQTVQEQFEALGADPEAALVGLPEQADEALWQERLNALAEQIARLGAVNLTALEEYRAQEQRLEFLDRQHQDLTASLTTLRGAIDRIDRECRSRFQDTFDRINAGLGRMFPKLFGGGQASLELIERDSPEAGVRIMARPPGKRNSSIHLLSGGEKALTAAALVFAIFELNPAPFCLLDEVDAPLDEANVGRFGQLVKEMSERVQFLFISHNKATMEIAQHLAGVTMKEPGVSRIVAVDLDAAVELATVRSLRNPDG
ncbi:chromosome segregation protein SMC [Candidatus Methylocalor cossyra]|uniref:Chromosome partition protein Smc n=1 Tax=Candidatus Methylocalor cossyra TaxID=3108543 RepID=A0ABM9NFQ6_9GAMM